MTRNITWQTALKNKPGTKSLLEDALQASDSSSAGILEIALNAVASEAYKKGYKEAEQDYDVEPDEDEEEGDDE